MSVEPAIAVETLDEIICGDREFLKILTDQFWSDLGERLPQLRDRVEHFDGPTVALLAHTIAGSASCIAAETLRAKAKALEACGRDRYAAGAAGLLRDLELEIGRVREFLDGYLHLEH